MLNMCLAETLKEGVRGPVTVNPENAGERWRAGDRAIEENEVMFPEDKGVQCEILGGPGRAESEGCSLSESRLPGPSVGKLHTLPDSAAVFGPKEYRPGEMPLTHQAASWHCGRNWGVGARAHFHIVHILLYRKTTPTAKHIYLRSKSRVFGGTKEETGGAGAWPFWTIAD